MLRLQIETVKDRLGRERVAKSIDMSEVEEDFSVSCVESIGNIERPNPFLAQFRNDAMQRRISVGKGCGDTRVRDPWIAY